MFYAYFICIHSSNEDGQQLTELWNDFVAANKVDSNSLNVSNYHCSIWLSSGQHVNLFI